MISTSRLTGDFHDLLYGSAPRMARMSGLCPRLYDGLRHEHQEGSERMRGLSKQPGEFTTTADINIVATHRGQ